jgi:hypothetical protein
MDNAAFRIAFPQFADETAYPDARLDLLATFVGTQLNACVWGDSLDFATMLYVAHLLTIQGPSNAQGGGGSGGGSISGPVTSKSVDKVSVSYDAGAVTYSGAAFWNQSGYGIQLYQLMQLFGAGPMHVLGDTAVLPFDPYGNRLLFP